jgi:predicted DNA-binding transcriptional regulator AlpA
MANATNTANTAAILAAFETLPDSAYVKRPVVQGLLGGICDEEVDRLEKRGKLPKRVKLGSRVNGWQVGALRNALAALEASKSEVA